MLPRVLFAGVACVLLSSVARPETVLDRFPFVVRSGLSSSVASGAADEKVLADLPFNLEQGYGYVGGTPGRRVGAAAFGGNPSWLLAWREGIEKYVFRVPHGEYLIELTFLETDVAAKGLRVFNVLAEEKELFHQVDIADTAGDFAWLTLSGKVGVYDGWLDLRFISSTAERPPRVSRVRISKGSPAVSPPVALPASSAGPIQNLGLKTYELKIGEDDLRKMSVRHDPPVQVPGELHLGRSVDYVLVSYANAPARWQRKKSYRILPDTLRNHRVFRRKSIHLSAEAGDPTLLREMVSADAASAIGLATPSVEPVALLVNGAYQGLYFDVEPLNRRFRQRTRLDRVGVLAVETRGDLFQRDWAPYGEHRGEEGNIMALTEFVHELNRLGEGEALRFFEDRFYLDRHVDRIAVRLLRGAAPERSFLLRDSRNGKWEVLEHWQPDGSLGVRDFEIEPRLLSDDDARHLLSGRSLQSGSALRSGASVLDTRFWSRPELRRRVFERFESLLAGALAPEKFDALVDKDFAKIREAALIDPSRWPADGGETFSKGPERLKADYRARAEVFRRVIARERDKAPSPIVLGEILAAPAEGGPWIELRNASVETVSLEGCFLSAAFQLPGAPAPLLPAKTLKPGETLLVRSSGGESLPLDPSGGFLALWRQRGAAPPELSDSIFYGHQTKGISYGRLPAGEWAHLAHPTPDAANDEHALASPPYAFVQGVTKEKSGGLRIWLKSRPNEAAGEKRPEKVTLRYHEEGVEDFQSVDLAWDTKTFQYSIGLDANPDRKRTSYYFAALSADGVERVYPLAAPALTFSLPVLPPVKINEVLPRPGRGPNTPGEFIEIYNSGAEPVDLDGYFLSDAKRNPTRWRIPKGNIVPPKGFIVFYADGTNHGNHTGFKLANSGEFLGLFGRMEEGNLAVDTIAFRGVRTGESWGANPDGSKNFRAWKDPTPGAHNIPKIPEEYLKKKKDAAGPVALPEATPKPPEPEEQPLPPDPDNEEDEEDR